MFQDAHHSAGVDSGRELHKPTQYSSADRAQVMGQMFTIFPMPLLLIDEVGCVVDGNPRAEQLWAVKRDAWPLVPIMSLLRAARVVGNSLVPWTSWSSLKTDLLSGERLLTQIAAPAGQIHRGLLFGMNLTHRGSRYLFMGFAEEQMTETGEMLSQWAQTDPVTGLYNRAYWLQHQTLWNKENGLVVMFDVDELKTVNDLYGHDEGDRMLAVIGRVLRECLLETGTVVRYGGDEFAAWMPETSLDAANAVVQAVEDTLGAQEVSAQLPVKPRVSTGMVAYQRGNLDKAVRDADEAMYEHKGTLLRSQNGGRLVLSRARLDVTTGQTESAVKPGGLAIQFRTEFDQIWRKIYQDAKDEAQRFVDFAQPEVGTAVVEVGAGTGRLAFDGQLADRVGPQGVLLLTDPSWVQLQQAQKRAVCEGYDWIRLVEAPAEKLPLASQGADLVIGSWFLHLADTAQALQELARVVRPHGRVALNVLVRWEWPDVWKEALAPLQAALRSAELPFVTPGHNQGEVATLMEGVGLAVEQTAVRPWALEFPDGQVAWRFFEQGGHARLMASGLPESLQTDVLTKLQQRMQDLFGEVPSKEFVLRGMAEYLVARRLK